MMGIIYTSSRETRVRFNTSLLDFRDCMGVEKYVRPDKSERTGGGEFRSGILCKENSDRVYRVRENQIGTMITRIEAKGRSPVVRDRPVSLCDFALLPRTGYFMYTIFLISRYCLLVTDVASNRYI